MAAKSFLSIIAIIAWVASLVVLQIPSPMHLQWVIALLLLGPLLLFPYAIQRFTGHYPSFLYFLSALLLSGAFWIDQGWLAFFLSIPWFLQATFHGLQAKRYLKSSDSAIIKWLKVGAGIFWMVGAAWAVLDRLGCTARVGIFSNHHSPNRRTFSFCRFSAPLTNRLGAPQTVFLF
jgi:hypothetical protein